jgi:hypothetical protein
VEFFYRSWSGWRSKILVVKVFPHPKLHQLVFIQDPAAAFTLGDQVWVGRNLNIGWREFYTACFTAFVKNFGNCDTTFALEQEFVFFEQFCVQLTFQSVTLRVDFKQLALQSFTLSEQQRVFCGFFV